MFGLVATWPCKSTRPGILRSNPFNDLKQRQIDVGQPAAGDVRTAAAVEQPLEISEIFRHPLLPEFSGAFLRRRPLIFVIQRDSYRMMGVVHLGHEIRDGE